MVLAHSDASAELRSRLQVANQQLHKSEVADITTVDIALLVLIWQSNYNGTLPSTPCILSTSSLTITVDAKMIHAMLK